MSFWTSFRDTVVGTAEVGVNVFTGGVGGTAIHKATDSLTGSSDAQHARKITDKIAGQQSQLLTAQIENAKAPIAAPASGLSTQTVLIAGGFALIAVLLVVVVVRK